MSSPDWAGPGATDPPLLATSPGAAHGTTPVVGFPATRAALASGGFDSSDFGFTMGRLSLGDDIEGEDWWFTGAIETRIYTGGILTFTLVDALGQRWLLITGPMPDIVLQADFSICGDLNAVTGAIYDGDFVDDSALAPEAVRAVAAALLEDLTRYGALRFAYSSVDPASQEEFHIGGRTGAYYNAQVLTLEVAP